MPRNIGSSPLLLAVDQGSSSSRAALFDLHGKPLLAAVRPLATFFPRRGWVEHDPQELLQSQIAALQAVVRKVPRRRPIVALGLCNQRSTLVIWRRRDGRPVGPALSWRDRRGEEFCARMQPEAAEIRRRTGLRLSAHYAVSKICWLLRHDGSLRRGLTSGDLLFGTVNTFLIWHLTGGRTYATDHTNAARMLLMNLASLKWDPYLLALFDLSAQSLPILLPTFSDFGTAQIDGRSIPIRCSVGDQQASLLGQGCLRSGEANINYGTGGFFLLHTGSRPVSRRGLLTSLASSEKEGAHYLLEGTVNAVGTLMDWLRRLTGLTDEASLDRLVRDRHSPRDRGSRSRRPLYLLPALFGLGAPHWIGETPSALLGFDQQTRPEDLLQAGMESVAYLIRDIVEAIGKPTRPAIKRITVSGGASRIDYLVQFQTDLLQTPLFRAAEAEAGTRGAALGAAIGSGLLVRESVMPPEGGRLFFPGCRRGQSDALYQGWRSFLALTRSGRRMGSG